jgi:hypothetical protein
MGLVHCPIHPGTLPKLLMAETDNGIWFDCFMGCLHLDIAAALNTIDLVLAHAARHSAEKQSPAASVLVTGLIDPLIAPRMDAGIPFQRALASVKNTHGPLPSALPFSIQHTP